MMEQRKYASAMFRLEVTLRAHVAFESSGSPSGQSSFLFPKEGTRKDRIPRRLCARESMKINRGGIFGRLEEKREEGRKEKTERKKG